MTKLKKKVSLETAFGTYVIDELLGEGGAGRVYGGLGPDNALIAVKVLSDKYASTEKRKRFKNEIGFLARNKHRNIVSVLDYGLATGPEICGPFYVMQKYHGNLRDLMKGELPATRVLVLLGQVLDGIEAAHFQDVIHRDIKPENILLDKSSETLAIADFGIARFTEDQIVTSVKTSAVQRLANFQYAAPEQRVPGQRVDQTADIYAIGLILNEMFTRIVPHGAGYKTIGQVSKEHEYLDQLVIKMIQQSPSERPKSIAEVKAIIQRYRADAVSMQRISQIDKTVIKEGEIDDPLAFDPPKLVNAHWNGSNLVLTMDRAVSREWVYAIQHLGNYSSVWGFPPESFQFNGNTATVACRDNEVQPIVDNFKAWLPRATIVLKEQLETAARKRVIQANERVRLEREAEEKLVRVNQNIRI